MKKNKSKILEDYSKKVSLLKNIIRSISIMTPHQSQTLNMTVLKKKLLN